ncbi:MAG: DUF1963 domain-containing protein [Planctomycetales bacterium]
MDEHDSSYIYHYKNIFTGEPAQTLNYGIFLPPRTTTHDGVRIEVGQAEGMQSHFFGVPRFTGDWPIGPNGPLTSLLSLRFDDVPEAPPNMPASGWLNVFYDFKQRDWGNSIAINRHWLVSMTQESTPRHSEPPADAIREQIPIHFSEDMGVPGDRNSPFHTLGGNPLWIQTDERVTAHLMSGQYMKDQATLSAMAEAGVRPETFMEPDLDALLAACRALDHHRIAPERFHPGVAEWQLLLQIDSDERLDLEWGDAGRIYVLIPTGSLKARRFEDCWVVMQCY